MAKVVSDIAVRVGADISLLQRGMKQGARELDTFDKRAMRMGANIASVAAKVTIALGTITAGTLALAKQAAATGAEIQNLASVAGVAPVELQKMAAATRTVGIEQDKLSDILKDVQDKVGDFLSTGGGPMLDFFEQIAPRVGVTAEQFRNLSGPQALQLYVDSLEKAGVSQSEFTFYMEALANDATALIPILRNGGAELQRLGNEAEAAGRIMSNETVAGAQALNVKFQELEGTIRSQMVTALIGLEDELELLAQFVVDYGIPALEGLIRFGAAAAEAITKVGEAIKFARDPGGAVGGNVANNIPGVGMSSAPENTDEQNAALNDLYGIDGSNPGTVDKGYVTPTGPEMPVFGAGAIPASGNAGRTISRGGSSSRGGGSGGGASADNRLQYLTEMFASERELELARYEQQLEDFAEYSEARNLSEEEANAKREELAETHSQAMQAIARAQQMATLDGFQSMFGDLASLMSTSNKKTFAIGKAAAIAEATITGIKAAVKAWDYGMGTPGGPAAAAAFAAASLAKTGALISQIQSTNLGSSAAGGTSGGFSSGGSVGSSGGQNSAPLDVSLRGINPAEIFMGEQLGSLLEALTKEAGDRGIRFV
ncbi:hypothetical protein [Mangrovicoccus sp. HB161399]|uniref:hypothetical protein n=1 Tax=Mangrovicoccus sp. HB161399 TaxID=2720392 RepID=UPI001556A228|nr:hypothetical protein [Mangrovicoccus sp. HB161399]